jgi:hypothetical protein
MTYRTRTLLRASVGLMFLLGLLLFVFFGVYRAKEHERRSQQRDRQIFEINDASIQRITIEVGADRTVCVRNTTHENPGGWVLVEPVKDDGDSISIEAFLGLVTRMEWENIIGGQDVESPGRYGLDKPRSRILLLGADGKTTGLRIGKINPFSGQLYVQVDGREDVLAVAGAIEKTLLKTTFELRRKDLVRLEVQKTRRLVLNDGKKPITLERGEDWRIVSPIRDRADEDEIERVFSVLRGVRAISFPPDAESRPLDYGFDPPMLTVTVQTDFEQTIVFGEGRTESIRGGYFVKRIHPPGPTMETTDRWREMLYKDVFGFQAKRPIVFDPNRVFRIRITTGRNLLVMEKKEIEKEGQENLPKRQKMLWKMISPVAAAVDEMMVEAWLTNLSQLKAKKFLGEKTEVPLSFYGLDSPEWIWGLFDREGKELGSLKGGRIRDGGLAVMGTSRDQLCWIDQEQLKLLWLDPEKITERP